MLDLFWFSHGFPLPILTQFSRNAVRPPEMPATRTSPGTRASSSATHRPPAWPEKTKYGESPCHSGRLKTNQFVYNIICIMLYAMYLTCIL